MDTINYVERFLHTNEPVLFETNAPMDKKHIEDFNKFNYTKRNTAAFTVNLIVGVLCILSSLAEFAVGALSVGVISVLVGIFCIVLPFMNIKKVSADSVKNGYHNGNINNYKFYQEYFVNTDFFSISIIPYNIVVDAHETDEYFYLYISKHQAHVIPKYSFVMNTPEEMRKMLTIKLGNRFTVHCL
ncbi:MAG: YcxB family protein [Oscillospiraceae bacterium]|nr:YcxB family protein [Oscillospiraceae bacterium]